MKRNKASVRGTKLDVERFRRACIEAAKRAYEDAGISGLCAEGRWECALQAMQAVDLRSIQDESPSPPGGAHG